MEAEREWIERIRAAGETESFQVLWQEAMTNRDDDRRRAMLHSLYAKWVSVDPEGCLTYAWKEDRYLSYPALELFISKDPEAAYRWARAGGLNQTRQFFFHLKDIRPDKFLEFALAAGPENHSDHELLKACQKLGGADPLAALESISKLSLKQRRHASWGVGAGWAGRDSASALDWARQIAEPAERQSALRGVLHALAMRDPQAARAHLELLKEVPGTEGMHPAAAIAKSLVKSTPRQALEFALAEISDSKLRGEIVFTTILPKLQGLIDPGGLAAILDKAQLVRPGEFTSGSQMTSDSPIVHYSVANGFQLPPGGDLAYRLLPENGDPAPVFRDLVSKASTPASKYLASEMAKQWIKADPAGALTEYQTSSGPQRETLALALLPHAAETQDVSLLALLESGLPAKASGVLGQIADSSTRHLTPREALDQTAHLAQNGQIRRKVTGQAVERWLGYDVGGVLEYAQSRPAGEQGEFYHVISRAWAQLDDWAGSEWVASLPPGSNRDQAASALADHLSMVEPASAVVWAGSILDATLRRETLLRSFGKWAGKDGPAAREALSALNQPPALKAELDYLITSQAARK